LHLCRWKLRFVFDKEHEDQLNNDRKEYEKKKRQHLDMMCAFVRYCRGYPSFLKYYSLSMQEISHAAQRKELELRSQNDVLNRIILKSCLDAKKVECDKHALLDDSLNYIMFSSHEWGSSGDDVKIITDSDDNTHDKDGQETDGKDD
jgi:hypothetical protein